VQDIEIIKKDIKHIYIRIKPPAQVILSVPKRTKQKTIDNLLNEKQEWINKQLQSFAQHSSPKTLEYIEGDQLYFLGKSYPLKVLHAPHSHVEFKNQSIYLHTPNTSSIAHKEAIINQWYTEQAKLYFDQAISKYHPYVNRPIHAVRIKKMKTRWGSCNHSKGYINLNVELIKKPLEALEYVVFHELVHLIHPNHSKAFYYYIEQYMEDWKAREALLK